jgi:hypothetical protein
LEEEAYTLNTRPPGWNLFSMMVFLFCQRQGFHVRLLEKEIEVMHKESTLKIGMVLVIGVGIQLLLILLGTSGPKDSPKHAVVEFAKAYFENDADMAERICKAHLTDKIRYAIENHIRQVAAEARSRGYSPHFMQSMLYAIKTETHLLNDKIAVVHFTAKRRTAINSVYFLVSLVFNLGEIHPVEGTFHLIKEGDHWKICDSFSNVFQNA